MADDLDTFLKLHSSFKYNEEKTRVICILTRHELPCNLSELKSYINGKKYQQLTRKETCDIAKVNEYKEYLIPSRKGKQKLYCTITKKEINNIPHQIENHVIGRKFQRDLKIYKLSLDIQDKAEGHQAEETIINPQIQKENNEKDQDNSEDSDTEMEDTSKNVDDDPEFVGGIWIPPGTKEDDDKIPMDVEENEVSQKNNKSKLKRKIKDNKKGKLQNQISLKKKR